MFLTDVNRNMKKRHFFTTLQIPKPVVPSESAKNTFGFCKETQGQIQTKRAPWPCAFAFGQQSPHSLKFLKYSFNKYAKCFNKYAPGFISDI